jgi:hypothetical protein
MDEYDSLHNLILLSVFNAGKNISYTSNDIARSYATCKKVLQLTNITPLEVKEDLKEIIFINGSKLTFKKNK